MDASERALRRAWEADLRSVSERIYSIIKAAPAAFDRLVMDLKKLPRVNPRVVQFIREERDVQMFPDVVLIEDLLVRGVTPDRMMAAINTIKNRLVIMHLSGGLTGAEPFALGLDGAWYKGIHMPCEAVIYCIRCESFVNEKIAGLLFRWCVESVSVVHDLFYGFKADSVDQGGVLLRRISG